MFDSDPAARAKAARLEREYSATPVFEEDEIRVFGGGDQDRFSYRHTRQGAF